MSDVPQLNVNSKELCKAIRSLEALSSMNIPMWIMASDTPVEFVKFVQDHFIEIQQEFEGKFKVTAVYPRFEVLNQVPMAGGMTSMKINFIKFIRHVSGMGLADSKGLAEKLPQEFKYFYFNTVEEAEGSKFMTWARRINLMVTWVPIDNTNGIRHFNDVDQSCLY